MIYNIFQVSLSQFKKISDIGDNKKAQYFAINYQFIASALSRSAIGTILIISELSVSVDRYGVL